MWHNLGKVNVTKGSDVVTGVGTKWVENVRVGDAFQGPDGKLYQVVNVASDGALAISPAYEGSTAKNLDCWIVPIPGFSKTQADRLALIINRLDGDIAKAFEEFLRKDSNLADVEDKKVVRDNLGITAAFDEFNSELLGINEELGTVLRKDSNLADVKDKKTARDNLGLGTAATRNAGVNAGNVMVVGAFGLGSLATENRHSKDLDNLVSRTGFYSINRGIENSPTTGGYLNTIELVGAGNIAQILFSNTNEFYIRVNRDGLLRGWRAISHSGNLRQATGSSTEYPMSQKAVTDAINGVSDRRDKAEIEDLEVGLSLIKNLKPKQYKLNLRSWYRDQEAAIEEVTTDPETGEETTSVSADPDVLAKPLSEYDDNDGSLAKDKPYTGFIAQELAHTLKELGLDDLGLVKNYQDEYGGDDRYYIEHEGLLAFIVKAIQEQQEQVEKLQLKVEQLEGKG